MCRSYQEIRAWCEKGSLIKRIAKYGATLHRSSLPVSNIFWPCFQYPKELRGGRRHATHKKHPPLISMSICTPIVAKHSTSILNNLHRARILVMWLHVQNKHKCIGSFIVFLTDMENKFRKNILIRILVSSSKKTDTVDAFLCLCFVLHEYSS